MMISRVPAVLKAFAVLVSICLVNAGLMSCTPKDTTVPEQSESNREVKRLISELERAYEREAEVDVIRMVHDDYSGGLSSRGDLRSSMSDVFRSYQRIRLDIYGTRISEKNGTINAKINWNLQWTCQSGAFDSDGDGTNECDNQGQVLRRTGRTTLGFQRTEDGWKLIQQRDDILLGNRSPGMVRHRS